MSEALINDLELIWIQLSIIELDLKIKYLEHLLADKINY